MIQKLLHSVKKATEWSAELFISFDKVWQTILASDAKVYNGLYSGLRRMIDGKASKPEKILKEWCIRTENHFGKCRATTICSKKIGSALKNNNVEKCQLYAEKLLTAGEKVGIFQEKEKQIVITAKNISAYIEWDGNELFEGDKVEVINPAWYQNGFIIEQGHCKIIGG